LIIVRAHYRVLLTHVDGEGQYLIDAWRGLRPWPRSRSSLLLRWPVLPGRAVVLRDVRGFRGAIQPRQDQFSRRKTALLRRDFSVKEPFHGGSSRHYTMRMSVLNPILPTATGWVKTVNDKEHLDRDCRECVFYQGGSLGLALIVS
jgi:hypothetical protein